MIAARIGGIRFAKREGIIKKKEKKEKEKRRVILRDTSFVVTTHAN